MASSLSNGLLYLAGIGFLTLSKTKNLLRSYKESREFDFSDIDKCIQYDIFVVDHWLNQLRDYTGNKATIAGKNILELGPGSDFGVGIYLLYKGCRQYNAIDVNNLMDSAPDRFYNAFFERLDKSGNHDEIDLIKRELEKSRKGETSRLKYVVRKNFDILSAFTASTIDLVFSNAAFEHFDNINKTAEELWRVCKPGAIVIAEIDLKTHTRWIREKDPNNIYRYSTEFYNKFYFKGIPNRMRPFQYMEAFKRSGWDDILITPLAVIEQNKAYPGLYKDYAEEKNQMEINSLMFSARKMN